MELETQECSNCRKIFPTDRIDLHEAYCCRNIRKCKSCDVMVDIKDQQQHERQFHSKKQCPLCKQMMQPSQLISHQELCPRKPKHCKFCENTWPQNQFNKHIQSCGARTKPCTICHKNIMLRDFQEHTGRCERRREEVSQDQMRQRGHRRNQRPVDRERQNSTNNIRQSLKSNSINKIVKPNNFKPSNIIGPELIKAVVDPIPISIRLAIKNKQHPRVPLKGKN